ncbi:hypothetical protein GQX74_009258 [Glossina fuscipes]|nr:hypothetical protein GQX74_009258 [Glossina fuscipes]
MRYARRYSKSSRNGAFRNEKPFACRVPGCEKRYKRATSAIISLKASFACPCVVTHLTNTPKYATLYDFFNGYNDLLQKRVVFVEDVFSRITEDYLRIRRYFRLYCSLAEEPFKYDESTLKIIIVYAAGTIEHETETQEDFKIDDHYDGDLCQNQCNRGDVSVPASYRQQWGNFDNECVAYSSTLLPNVRKKTYPTFTDNERSLNNLITAGERELLKEEFISLMHERFLTEQDGDFDYSTVDDNTQFDNLQQINQDKYFAESADDDNVDIGNKGKIIKNFTLLKREIRSDI